MKSISKYIALLLLPGLAACEYDDVSINLETPEDTMHIAASSEEVVLEADKAEETAVTFSWGAAADRGPETSLTYLYRIALAENISEAKFTEMTDFEVSYTVDDFNDLLLEWGVSPETTTEVTAEVVAKVNDETKYQKPEVSKITILATGFRAVSRPLWIVNGAMDAGSDDEMTEVVLSKQYSWAGWFEPETGFKFVYDRATGLPSLNKGDGDNEVVKRNSDSDPDGLFTVDQAGYYNVNISTKTMTCTWELLAPTYDAVWMVGDAAPCGWDIDNPDPMTQKADNPWIFEWDGHLNTGELKLPLALGQSWGCDYFMPEVNYTDQNGSDKVVVIPGGNPDNKWNITEAGDYHVEVNSFTMKIKFEKKN